MVALVQDPMPDYIVIIPLLYGAFFVLALLAVAVIKGGKSRPRNTGSESRREHAPRRWSSDDDIWLSSCLSDLERGQYHDRR